MQPDTTQPCFTDLEKAWFDGETVGPDTTTLEMCAPLATFMVPGAVELISRMRAGLATLTSVPEQLQDFSLMLATRYPELFATSAYDRVRSESPMSGASIPSVDPTNFFAFSIIQQLGGTVLKAVSDVVCSNDNEITAGLERAVTYGGLVAVGLGTAGIAHMADSDYSRWLILTNFIIQAVTYELGRAGIKDSLIGRQFVIILLDTLGIQGISALKSQF